MKKKLTRKISFILLFCLTLGVLRFGISRSLTAEATTMSEIQQEIDRLQQELEEEYGKISDLEEEQDLILEQMDDLNSEIINTMASIGLKEEEISEKEDEIVAKEKEIEEKQKQIVLTAAEYEAAKEREEAQREDMSIRARMLYEQGTDTYLSAFLGGTGLADILNRLDYIERIYEYSKFKLDGYIEAKDEIQNLWKLLEEEEADLQQHKEQLINDKANLVDQESQLKAQKANLDVLLNRMRKQSADYDAAITKARQEAAVAQKLLKQNQDRLKQLEAAQTVVSGTYTSDYSSVISKASGSDLGKKIANYACQYIGNPYVYGGTSLTNGTDCSGFTYRVYSNFGYTLPRTSYDQRSAGTGVSYEDAQPGDLICYEGHVGMYIGGGYIVHASNSSPYPHGGIKVNKAQYRPILAVRRII